MCLFLKHIELTDSKQTSPKTLYQPEEEHDGAGVVELVHLVKVGHLSDVDQVDHHKVLALLSDRIESLVHFHAGRVPVVTEPVIRGEAKESYFILCLKAT